MAAELPPACAEPCDGGDAACSAGSGRARPSPPSPEPQQPAPGVSPSDGASPPSNTALQAAMADFVSPFASSFAQAQPDTSPPGGAEPPYPAPPAPQQQQMQQQQRGPRPGAAPPPERQASGSGSPRRVVGFEQSPTSVVSMRRWQSAAVPGSTDALAAAAAMDAALDEAGGGTPEAPGGARGPRSFPPTKPSCSLDRKVRRALGRYGWGRYPPTVAG